MAPVHQLSTALGIETCVASVRGSRDLAPTGMRVSVLLCRHESDTCGGQGVLGHPTAREERRPCQSCGTGWMESGTYTPRSPHRPDVLCPPEPLSGATALPLNLSSIPGPHILGPLFYRGRKDRQESAEHLPGSPPSCPVAQASRRPPDLLHPRDAPPSFRMAGGG